MNRLGYKSFLDYTKLQREKVKNIIERIKLAEHIGKNAYETGLIDSDPSQHYPLGFNGPKSHLDMEDPDSDTRLRISSNQKRSYESGDMSPVLGTISKDPVYRKLSKAAQICNSGIIRDVANELQTKMENRYGMGELMYDYFNSISLKRLLSDLWEIENDGGSLNEHEIIKRWHNRIEDHYQKIQEKELQKWLKSHR